MGMGNRINEAGQMNKPTNKKPKDGEELPEFGTSGDQPVDDAEDSPGAGEDMSQDERDDIYGDSDAEPDWVGNESEPEEDQSVQGTDDEEPAQAQTKFASASQPPKRKSEEETVGLRISGDRATLAALRDALEEYSGSGRAVEDVADWIDDCVRAIDMANRRNSDTVTLPKFEATPDLDSFDDDAGDEEDF
jgi:hypothetical protein